MPTYHVDYNDEGWDYNYYLCEGGGTSWATPMVAGIAGSMYSHYIMFIDPSILGLSNLIFVFSMVVAGGLGSTLGAVLGGIVILLLPEPLRFLPIPSSMVGAIRMMIFSAIVILMIIFRPEGIIKEKTFKVKKC